MTGPTEQQRRFLDAELFQLTLGAVVQRGKVYEKNLKEQDRSALHRALNGALVDLSAAYAHPVTNDEIHLINIEALAVRVSTDCRRILLGGHFRIGSAQKALNLWLKYRWCAQMGPMPPHCPFDSFVLAAIKGWKGPTWTVLDKPEDYQKMVDAARRQANGVPLAEWELELYNRVTALTRRSRE